MRLRKTNLRCAVCGNDYTIKEHRLLYLRYYPKVCSVDCLSKLFKSGQPITNINDIIACMRKDVYIRNNYKSSWELEFVDFLKKYDIKFLYEPFAFKSYKNRYYIPDFYLVDSGIFIEIKGIWEGDAKKKFLSFLDTFGLRTYLIGETFMPLLRSGKW